MNAGLEATLRLRVRGPTGTAAEFDAIIDTGYTGLLTLPAATAEGLGLERGMGGRATLADGSARRIDTFAAELEWGGEWRSVVVSALGGEVLIGMRLLAGHELRVQATPGGAVEITDPVAVSQLSTISLRAGIRARLRGHRLEEFLRVPEYA